MGFLKWSVGSEDETRIAKEAVCALTIAHQRHFSRVAQRILGMPVSLHSSEKDYSTIFNEKSQLFFLNRVF